MWKLVGEGEDRVAAQAFIPQLASDAFHPRSLHRLAGLAERQRDVRIDRPRIDGASAELTPIVEGQPDRCVAVSDDALQRRNDGVARQDVRDRDRHAFVYTHIHDGERPTPTAGAERVAQEVDTLPLVGGRGPAVAAPRATSDGTRARPGPQGGATARRACAPYARAASAGAARPPGIRCGQLPQADTQRRIRGRPSGHPADTGALAGGERSIPTPSRRIRMLSA